MDAPTTGSAAATGDGMGLFTVLSTDFLLSPSGNKVDLKELEGKTIGLYFAANWYWKCETFTPILTLVYHQLKEEGSKFEIVFVSSDEDHASFERFHSLMPWPAIPFGDLQSRRSLTQKFQIEGIPSLIIINSKGELVQTDGVELINRYECQAFPFTSERMAELEADEKAKHASQTLEKLLSLNGRDCVIDHKRQVPISELVGKTVGLYFSARWSSPCSKFTSRLASIYNNLKEKDEEFEIVFVSMDKDEAGYLQCYGEMPWLALRYNHQSSKALARYFDVQGIPALIIIGPDGKTVTREGRNLINLHLEMAFPFTEARIRLLQERMDEEARCYPRTLHHAGHRHILNLVSENTGGGPYLCCECEEQGLGWAYQCLGCGYEIHLKCGRGAQGECTGTKQEETDDPSHAFSSIAP